MKKAYQKPQLYYESFALSQTIASGCEGIANLGEGNCSVTISENGAQIQVFINESICEYYPPGGDDEICYHAPGDWNNVYSS